MQSFQALVWIPLRDDMASTPNGGFDDSLSSQHNAIEVFVESSSRNVPLVRNLREPCLMKIGKVGCRKMPRSAENACIGWCEPGNEGNERRIIEGRRAHG